MRKVAVIGHQSLLDPVMSRLQRLNIVHIVDVSQSLSAETLATLDQASPANAPQLALEEQVAHVRSAVDLLDEHFKVKKGVIETFSGVRYALTEREYRQRAEAVEHIQPLLTQADKLKAQLRNLETRQNSIRDRLEILAPWENLDIPVSDIRDTELLRVQLGEITASSIGQLRLELEEAGVGAYHEVVSHVSDRLRMFLVYPKRQQAEIQILLRQVNWSPVSLPFLTGTVAEEIRRLRESLQALAEEQDATLADVQTLVEERLTLYAREDELRNRLDREAAKELLGYTQRLFVLHGWVRAKDLPQLRTAMRKLSPAIVVEDEPPAPGELYPVDLENPSVVQPFEVITRVAGLPQAGALDPTPYLTPFFFVFFGLCLGDAGYGIVLSILSLWLIKRANAVGMGRQLMYLMAICGISTVLSGALTGSWFGDLLGIPPLWFNPVENPLPMLALSIGLGVLQIFAALGIKAYDNIRRGHLLNAVYDQVLWLIFLSGLVMMLISANVEQLATLGGAGKYLSLGGAIGLVLTQGRHQSNPVRRLLSGLLSLYGVSGYMSDVLSYSRLLALGMASGVVAMVLNDAARRLLAIPVVGWVFTILILVGGHLFNLLINLVSAYVHSSRLQYVEFFTKFLEAGGRPFEPLSERHRYLVVEPDAASPSRT